jgi:4-hydroxy-tetrahydrodipicolinate synthase
MAEFRGIVAAILTPFDENDQIDFDFMKRHIRFLEDGGVQGFVPSGTNGEAPSMRLEERKQVIDLCAKNKGKLFMVAGTGATGLSETIELSRFAESAGTDALMVLPPFFFKGAPLQGLIDYFKRVFDSVSVPIFLYNIPQCTGVAISDELVRALEHYPHLAGIKDSSCDRQTTMHYIKTFPNLKVFVGNDHDVLAVLKAGGVGHISGLPNAMPEFTTALWDAWVAGQDATPYQERQSAVRSIMHNFPDFSLNKYVLSLRGFPMTYCRLPLLDVTEDEKTRFVQLMKDAGLWMW